MDPDDLVIRPARLDEVDALSHLLFRSLAYWEYPREFVEYWLESGELNVSPCNIENNYTYVVEDDEELDIIGFYSMCIDGDECTMNHLWIVPEYVGSDLRSMLFFHACEMAETAGAESVTIVAYPHISSFYLEMGAEQIGEKADPSPLAQESLPVLRLEL